MITATEAAMITYVTEAKKPDGISIQMKEYISKEITRTATQGRTRMGFTFGGDMEYCLAVAKWATGFGYSAWFDYSREPAILWLGWNAQVEDLRKKGE